MICIILGFATVVIPTLAAAASLSAQVPEELRRAGRLVVATDAEFAPCESLAADGRTVIGFDADIWNALGAKLGLKVTPISTTFGGIISGVQSGRYPVAISCISDSAARERQALFIDYAYATGASNTKITPDGLSLCGLKTAAEAGTDSVDSLNKMSTHCLRHGRPAIAISQFPSANAMFSALVAQRVDFVVNDAVAADAMRAQFPVKLRVIASDQLPKLYTGMIVKQQAQPLANVLLAALMAIQADGTYGRIMQKWRLGFLQLDTPGLNLATRRPLPEPQP
jgi:polar amino acid transport system substrate-binding protein